MMPSGIRFVAEPSETLLGAARRAGWRMPSLCRNGSCRACLAHRTAGAVDFRIRWPSLLPEEREAGSVLLCVAEARSDLVLWQPAFTGDDSQRA